MKEWKVFVMTEEETIYKLVEGMLAELVQKQWGTGKLEVSMQGGNIVSVRKSVEQVVNLKRANGVKY